MSHPYFYTQEDIERFRSDPELQRERTEHQLRMEEYALSGEYRRSLNDALISSEIRHLGARLRDFYERLEPFLSSEVHGERRSALIDLYARFSTEIELIQAAAHQIAGAGEVIDSFVDVLRTPLEEGIIALSSGRTSRYGDPHKVKRQLRSGYRCELHSHTSSLRGLSPTQSRDDFSFHVHIEEYGGARQALSRERCKELLELANSRVIDTSRDEPQEGFGRSCAVDEFMGFVERTSTVCCVPCDGEGVLGLYLLDTDRENIPQAARGLIERDHSHDTLNDQNGWVDLIALTTTARDRLRGPSDVWYIAGGYAVAQEYQLSKALGDIALRPVPATDVGPGDYIRDTKGVLHQICLNTASDVLYPSSWLITTREGKTLYRNDIDLYLKTNPISLQYNLLRAQHRDISTNLRQVLLPTTVTDVGSGDFIRDMDGVIREIEFNSARNERFPRAWDVVTTDGQRFDMFSISAYLKCEQFTEECIRDHSPPSLYRWVTWAVCETACAAGISTLWCQVRVGRQANTSREKHLAVGWESTDLVFTTGEREYEILRLNPYKILTGLSDGALAKLRQQQFEYPSEYARLRALASEVWSTQLGTSPGKDFSEIFKQRFPGCTISHSTDLLGRLRVTVNPASEQPAYFQQELAGYDLWRVQRQPCYSLSLDHPLRSLEQTIAIDPEELCSRHLRR